MEEPEYNFLAHQLVELKQQMNRMFDLLQSEKTITVAQFAKATNTPNKTVIYWCKEGILRATQMGNGYQWMILRSEVERVVELAKANVKDEGRALKVIKRWQESGKADAPRKNKAA
jgi:hypothetical protein